jgi:hypothetical protein
MIGSNGQDRIVTTKSLQNRQEIGPVMLFDRASSWTSTLRQEKVTVWRTLISDREFEAILVVIKGDEGAMGGYDEP